MGKKIKIFLGIVAGFVGMIILSGSITAISHNGNKAYAQGSDLDKAEYFMSSLLTSCKELPDESCNSDLKSNYDFYCADGKDLLDSCPQVKEYLETNGAL